MSRVSYSVKELRFLGEFTFAVVEADAQPKEPDGAHALIELRLAVRSDGEISAVRARAIQALRRMIREDELLAALDAD